MYYSRQNKRGANFSQHERDVLIDCVQKYKHVIEDKKTDSKTIYKKQKAWARILVLYNSQLGVTKRVVKQLQSAWKNMKRNTKVFKEPENMDGDRRVEDKRRENARVRSVLETSSNDLDDESDDNSPVPDDQDDIYIETDDIDIKSEPIDDDYQLSNIPESTSPPPETHVSDHLTEPPGISLSNENSHSLMPTIQMVPKLAVPISSKPNPKVQSSITSRLLAPKPPQPPPTYQVILHPNQNGANIIQHLQPIAKKQTPSGKRKTSPKTLMSNKSTQIMVNNQPSYITLQPSTGVNQDASMTNQNHQVSPVINNIPLVVKQHLPNGNVSLSNTIPISQLQQIANSKPSRSATFSQVTEQQTNSNKSANSYKFSQQEHLEKMKTLRLERILMRREHEEKIGMYKAQRDYYVEKKRKLNTERDS